MNIEDTIFENTLAINIYPMIVRFIKLLDENLVKNQNWRQDKRIEKLLYLILITWNPDLQLGDINFGDWWNQLNQQQKEAIQQ